jgi:hypothetical protein
MEQLGFHWGDFNAIRYLMIFCESVEKSKFSLKLDNNKLFIISRSFPLRREIFQTKVVEKIKTHILCSVAFLKNRTVYEIMWENIVERDTPQMTIWRMLVK